MHPERVAEGVYLLPFPATNVYLWERGSRLTLLDTGVPGSADAIVGAITALGHAPAELDEIIFTHFHRDHSGSAAELVRRTSATVLAHPVEAPIIEGSEPPPKPVLTQLERPLAEQLLGDIEPLPGPQPEAVQVDCRVDDGDRTAGGGQIVWIAGHTRGSIAVYLPDRQLLFTGDSIASYESAPILGPFNLNASEALAALRKQAKLEFEIACVGHGRPIVGGARARLLAMIRSLPSRHAGRRRLRARGTRTAARCLRC